jgi:hypothetical protein
MTNEPKYFEIWETIRSAIRTCIIDVTRQYDIAADALEIIEQPARTVVVQAKDNASGAMWAQASISLDGHYIEIRRSEEIAGSANKEPEVIEIEVKNGVIGFIHDDIDRTTSPHKVAEIILEPILDKLKRRTTIP